MTSSDQLNKYMFSHLNEIKGGLTYVGCFASNQIPYLDVQQRLSGACLIVNYDPAYKNGSHWCGIRINPKKNGLILAEWFDSYGKRPDSDDQILKDTTNFNKWLKNYSDMQQYNEFDFQGTYADTCGLWSCYFCLNGLPQNNPAAYYKFYKYPAPKIYNSLKGYIVQDTNNLGKSENDALIKKVVNIPVKNI